MFTHLIETITPHQHATTLEARACEEDYRAMWAWEAAHDRPTCSICDGTGHGYPGGGPCPLEVSEVAAWETDQEERMALAWA